MDPRSRFEPLASGQIRPGKFLFGRYLVVTKLGEGGMGSVWLVRHEELDAFRALKLILPGIAFDPGARARFGREAQVMARLSHHPNAVVVHNACMGEDAAFIEMEYLRGRSLDQVMRPGVPMPPAWVARVLEQLCDVLQEAHERNVVHRDLKPSNLMIIEGGAPDRVRLKVLDFGIAKILKGDDEGGEFPTDTGDVLGSMPWISPEQASGGRVFGRSDIYSIGVILYEMLTGYRPFCGPKMKLLRDHLSTPPPTFAEKNPGASVPPEVERVVMRCLAKDPEDRPQTPRELVQEFSKALGVASSRPARDLRFGRALGRAGDYLMGRAPSQLGLRPEAPMPPAGVVASKAPADSELIACKPLSRVGTKTSAHGSKPVVMVLTAGCLLLTCRQADGPFPRSSSRPDASRPAPEWACEIGGVAMEFVLLPWSGIYMGKYEVTNRQFRDYRDHRGLPAPEAGFNGPDLPAVSVSWDDARGFCERETERSQGRLTVRLPTEKEWDDASGAVGVGLAPGKGNFEGPVNDPFPGITPVGRFPANSHGLHDMFGNVWEWIHGESREDCRLGVMRGGSFVSDPVLLRNSRARDERPADSRHSTVGFRVMVVPSRSDGFIKNHSVMSHASNARRAGRRTSSRPLSSNGLYENQRH